MSRITDYFKESYHELRKVAWPNRREVLQSTIVVIVISLVTAAFLGLLDFFFDLGLQRIL